MKHMPALDGLRAVAILTVVASHVITPKVPGGFGVTLFFFISGFIITRLLMLEPAITSAQLQGFYIKRFFRLAPALFVFLFTSGALMGGLGDVIPVRDYAATLLYFANYHSFTAFPPVVSPLAVTWSLAVEEHFYLVFPLVLMLFRARIVSILVGTLAVALVWRCVLVFGLHASTNYTYTATDCRLDSIAWGCLLSVLLQTAPQALTWLSSRAAQVAAAAALVASFAVRNDAFRETLRYSLQGFAFFVLFYGLFRPGAAGGRVQEALASAPMQFVGRISYSLYLYHFLALSIATALMPAGPARIVCVLVAAFASATLSHRFVEQPIRRIGAQLALGVSRRGRAVGGFGETVELP
jgi:peptidoglycan/LPS O-acetylase OafA/YrhL